MILLVLAAIVLFAGIVINALSADGGAADFDNCNRSDFHADNSPIIHYQYDPNDMCYAMNIGN